MKCNNCNSKIPTDSEFCPECGNATKPSIQNNSQPLSDYEPISNGLKYGVFAATLLIPLLGLIMGIIFKTDKNPHKKSVGGLWLWTGIIMIILNILFLVSVAGI